MNAGTQDISEHVSEAHLFALCFLFLPKLFSFLQSRAFFSDEGCDLGPVLSLHASSQASGEIVGVLVVFHDWVAA